MRIRSLLVPLGSLALSCTSDTDDGVDRSSRQAVQVAASATCSVEWTKIDYDTPGNTDVAEFIELRVRGSGATLGACGLSRLQLINSATCNKYVDFDMSTVAVPADGYVVLCDQTQRPRCDVNLSVPGGIQNGSPDEISFVGTNGAETVHGTWEGAPVCLPANPGQQIVVATEDGNLPNRVNVWCDGAFVLRDIAESEPTVETCPLADGGVGGSGGSTGGSGGSTGGSGGSTGGSGGSTGGSGGSTGGSGGSTGGSGGGFIVDHSSLALFDQIPDAYVTAARNLRLVFSDRSVGQNINESLNCLAAASWAQSPASCRRDWVSGSNFTQTKLYTQTDLDAGTVPSWLYFPASATKYNRANWTFEYRGGDWSFLTQDFITSLAPSYLATKDVLTYQFSYLNVDSGDISSPTTGFFANTASKYDIYDLEAFIAQHPDKKFPLWTSSLARGIGTQISTDFNAQMRAYALSHGKALFDVADIESHTPSGAPCYDNRDGVQYCSGSTNCENWPDDGVSQLAMCQDYTTETNGGHLGSVSGARIRIAKGFWILMARLAGWNP